MEFENKKLRDVAEIAAQIMSGQTVTEKLHPNQQKLDVHEPEKDELTAKDFEMLRNKKKMKEEAEEVVEETIEEATPPKNTDVADKSYLKDMGKKPTVASDLKNLGRFITGKKETKEEVDQAAATILEYESKDGRFVHKARPGAYGGSKDEKHAVDTLAGPKEKELKSIEDEKKKKKFSEDLDLYKEQGIKGLFEAWGKKKAMKEEQEQISEEPTSAEFDAQLTDAKQRAAGTKKQAEVSKPAVQAVQNEETHTTVEVLDLDPINGVQRSEIDLTDLEERTLTEPETKKKEEIVKSMKKGIAGFKDRYGDRAKEVMYATATARAKGE